VIFNKKVNHTKSPPENSFSGGFLSKKIGLKCIKYISTVTKIKESIICGAQIVSANPFLFKTAVKTNTN